MGFNYKRPKPIHICAYIERLVEKGLSPGTIRNQISAIKTYMTLKTWSTKSWRSLKVANALKAVDRNVRHVPVQRAPVTPRLLRKILPHIKSQPNGPMMTLAILLMFEAFLRQSNVLPKSVSAFDSTRHLTVLDVRIKAGTMAIKVKWSKTQQTLGDCQVVNLHPLPGSPLCPVAALHRAQHSRKAKVKPSDPLISFTDGNPITLGYIKRAWASALSALNLSPKTYSLHSLRRGGASYCYYEGGASFEQVKRHGGWRTDCVRAYLRPPPQYKDSVHKALQDL